MFFISNLKVKKVFSYIFLIVLIFGIFSPVFHIHGQVPGDPNFVGPVQSAPNNNSDTGGWSSWLNPLKWAPSLLGFVFYWILKVVSLFMGLTGLLLNFVINTTVVNMSSGIKNMIGINYAWKIVRDLLNMVFIFILVYYGILLILSLKSTQEIRRFIVAIVVASILVNFSLFFTKVIIDASNVVTIGIYNFTLGENLKDDKYGLSNAYQNSLGLQGFFSKDSITLDNLGGDNFSYLTVNVMGSILFLVVSFVFLAISVMFTIRYLVLLILLALSPIAYLGTAIPGLGGYSKQWWEVLWGQVLFAPIYMIMTLVVLTLMNSGGFIGGKINYSQWPNIASANQVAAGSSVQLLFNFALVIGLTIASLVIAKKYSTQGATQIGKLTSSATALAGGAVFGGAARLGRNTVGRAGNAIANSERMKDASVSDNFFKRNLAKAGLATGNRAATSSFDVRASNVGKTTIGQLGVDFGKAPDRKKVNFQKEREELTKKKAEFAKSLKPTDEAVAIEKEKTQKPLDEAKEKAGAEHDVAKDKLDAMKKEKERLEKERDSSVLEESKRAIQEKIDGIDKEIKEEEKNVGNLEKASEKASTAAKENEERIKNIFKTRVDKYAESFEKESNMGRWAKNILKVGAGGAVGSVAGGIGAAVGAGTGRNYGRTKSDNRAIAVAIRKVTKGKTADEELRELYKKKKKEAEDRGEGESWKEEGGEKSEEKEEKSTEPPATPPTT